MVEEILGVVYDVDPLASKFPPVASEYQSMVSPVPGVAEIATVPAPQRDALPADGGNG